MRTAFVVGLLALVGGGAFAVGRWGDDSVRQRKGAEDTEASSAETITPPKTRKTSSRPTKSDLRAVAEPAAEPAEAPAPEQEAKPKTPPPEFADLKDEVKAEPVDLAWARDLEARVTAELAEDVKKGAFRAPVRVISTQCGNTRCAVEAVATDPDDADELGRTITGGLGLPRGRVFSRKNDDGTQTTNVIAAREGFNILGRPSAAHNTVTVAAKKD